MSPMSGVDDAESFVVIERELSIYYGSKMMVMTSFVVPTQGGALVIEMEDQDQQVEPSDMKLAGTSMERVCSTVCRSESRAWWAC